MSSWETDKLFSSKRHDWETPKSLFDTLNKEFEFGLDAAAQQHNAKLDDFITPSEDALNVDWEKRAKGRSVWLNPPYGRNIGDWIKKAYFESLKGVAVVVLTFVRSDTAWWHEWAMKAAEIRLIRGRVTFVGASQAAPAPSCLIVFDESKKSPNIFAVEVPRK